MSDATLEHCRGTSGLNISLTPGSGPMLPADGTACRVRIRGPRSLVGLVGRHGG